MWTRNWCSELQAGCYYIQLDSAVTGVFPFNATSDGLARPIKAQYYKNGAANFLRVDSFGATGVLCVDDLKE